MLYKYTGQTVQEVQKMMAEKAMAFEGMPESFYHAFPALSNSGMKEFEKAPGIYHFMKNNPDEDTDSRRKGRLLHMAIGEPHRLSKEVAVVDGNRNSKDVKALVEAYEAAGKLVIKSTDLEDKIAAAKYCREHKLVKTILKKGTPEVSFFWIDKDTGAPCKARLDWLTDTKKGVIADWKEFDANYDEDLIERQIRTMNYHYQMVWYSEAYTQAFGHRPADFYNVFIRTKKGIRVQVTRIVDHAAEEVFPIVRGHVMRFAECFQKDHWPMNDEEVLDIVVKPFF